MGPVLSAHMQLLAILGLVMSLASPRPAAPDFALPIEVIPARRRSY